MLTQCQAQQLEQGPDTPQAMRLHSIYSHRLRGAARERKQWIADSVVYNQLTHLAQTRNLYWNTILSYLVPDEMNLIDLTTWYVLNPLKGDEGDEIKSRARFRAGQGRYWTGTFEGGRNAAIYLNWVYYLKVPEKTVTHYFPCIVDKKRPHLHTRSTGRNGDRYDDSDEDHDAVNILYWYCHVCCTTFTDERYESLNVGISNHLRSPHHVHMRHRRRYPQLPWMWSARMTLYDHNTFFDVGNVSEWCSHKGKGKGRRTPPSEDCKEAEIPKWFRLRPCSELHRYQDKWFECSGWLYHTKDQWLRCDNIVCDHHSCEQIDRKQVERAMAWRRMTLRLLMCTEGCESDEGINQQPVFVWGPPIRYIRSEDCRPSVLKPKV